MMTATEEAATLGDAMGRTMLFDGHQRISGATAPGIFGVAVGAFTDATFPPPMISGFEAYGHPWALTASDLPMPGGAS